MSKKIYFVVHDFSSQATGGVNRVVSETANELAKDQNIEVNILSLAPIDSPCYKISSEVQVHSLDMEKHSTTHYSSIFKVLWLIKSFLKIIPFYLKERRVSAWNLTSPPLIILFAFIFKGKNIFINCEHASPMRKKSNFILDGIRRFFLNRADLTISLNKKDQKFYEKKGIKAKLVYNGVKFSKNIINKREKTIIFVGRFEEQKNPLIALEIFYESKLWKNGYILKFFGSGKFYHDIIEKVKYYDIGDKVFLITDETDPDKIYTGASCLIMTSKYEGLPMVLIEAISRGIPCISYDCPQGPSEIIIDGVNGFLIENGNKSDFIKKLSELNYENFLRKEIVSSAKKFDINYVVEEWKDLIKPSEVS